MIKANDPSLQSWIEVPANGDFPIQNLPFGIKKYISFPFLGEGDGYAAITIIGETVINLAALQKLKYFSGINLPEGIFQKEFLNDFIALGKHITRAVRERLSEIFNKDN